MSQLRLRAASELRWGTSRSRDFIVDTVPSDLERMVRLPLDAEVKVTTPRGDWSGYARVVSEARGVVELMGSGRKRFPRTLGIGATVIVVAEVHDRRIVAEARVQSCTATYLRASYVGRGELLERRRKHGRVEMHEAVRVIWARPSGTEVERAGTLTDLSVSGCQLRVEREILEGTEVSVPLQLDQAVELRGVVVRSSVKPGEISVGVRFDEMPPADRAALLRFLTRRTRANT